jgi:hypothetical protein
MKAIATILMLLTTKLAAQWLVVKPAEFEPLTSLPWHVEDATRETVLGAVFREPDADIRYRVLGEYLKRVPADDMANLVFRSKEHRTLTNWLRSSFAAGLSVIRSGAGIGQRSCFS